MALHVLQLLWCLPEGGGWAMVCVILCTVTEVLSTCVTQAERLLTVWAA